MHRQLTAMIAVKIEFSQFIEREKNTNTQTCPNDGVNSSPASRFVYHHISLLAHRIYLHGCKPTTGVLFLICRQ